MLIFERLIGVGIYSLLLAMVCLLLVKKEHRSIRLILFIYSIILSIMAFYYVPSETADLSRIYNYIDIYKKYSFENFFEIQVSKSASPVSDIIYWLISKTGVPQLLPALTSFICYNCVFYIIGKTSERNKISGKNVALTLFFYMSLGVYIFVISGIRCMLGISIALYCFYKESVLKKNNIFHIFLYLIAGLIHSFALVIILVRLIIPLFELRKKKWVKISYFIFICLLAPIIFIYFNSYLVSIFEKILSYMSEGSYFYLWDYIVALVSLVAFFLILQKNNRKSYDRYNLSGCYIYSKVILAIGIFSCWSFTIFHRSIIYVLSILSIPLLMNVLQQNDMPLQLKRKETFFGLKIRFDAGLLLISVFLLLINCTRGSLSALKFFIFK